MTAEVIPFPRRGCAPRAPHLGEPSVSPEAADALAEMRGAIVSAFCDMIDAVEQAVKRIEGATSA